MRGRGQTRRYQNFCCESYRLKTLVRGISVGPGGAPVSQYDDRHECDESTENDTGRETDRFGKVHVARSES